MPKPKPRPTRSTRSVPLLGAIAGILALAILGFLFRPARPPATGSDTPAPPAPSEPASLYGSLRGRWLRTDGDYLLDVRAIDGAGVAQVDYFNPRPIHVARAEATRDGDNFKLVVVLEDVGYPGSSYTLAYLPGEKVLAGEYYQAALQETFDVRFTRLP
jgi:hypothetical protein